MRRNNLFSPSHAHYNWFVVSLLWMSHAIYFFNYSSLGVLGPLLKQELVLSNTHFGFLFGFIFMGSMVLQIPAGIWCDQFGVRKVMSWGLLTIGGSIFFFSICRSLFLCYVTLFFLGVGTGCSQVSATKSVMDWFPFKGRATAMGVKQTGVNIGGIMASLLFPFLITKYHWRFLLEWIGFIIFAFAFLFFLLYRDSSKGKRYLDHKKFHFQDTFTFFKDRNFMIVTLSGVFLMIVQFSFSSYLVLYLNQTHRYPLEQAGVLLALSFGTGAIARIGWSLLSDYLFKNRKSPLIIIGGFGAFIILVLSLTTASSPSWIIYLLSISFGITGMGWNAIWLTLIGELSSKETTGLGIGLSFFIASFGAAIGPPFFGMLIDLFNSFIIAWLFLAFCMIVVSFLILLARFKSTNGFQIEISQF